MEAADEIFEDIETKIGNIFDNGTKTESDESDDQFSGFDNSFISGVKHISSGHVCKKILYISLCPGTSVRAWDVLLFLPTLAFLIFLGIRWSSTKRKLLATHSPIFRSFHVLVAGNTLVTLFRSIIAMIAGSFEPSEAETTDRSTWIISLAILMMTEISVITYGLAGAQLDSKKSIIRVSMASTAIASIFALISGILEFHKPEYLFAVHQKDSAHYQLFGYGGSLYAMVTATCFTAMYLAVLTMPLLPCVRLGSITLPNKPSFYQYSGFLLLVHLLQAIGAGMLYFQVNPNGLCILNFGTFLYMTVFTPLVYSTFLGPFFKTAQPTLLFTYKAQIDDEEDEENAPNQHSVQFSLTPGSVDLTDDNEPIVRNGVTPTAMPALVDGLASPDSVEIEPTIVGARY